MKIQMSEIIMDESLQLRVCTSTPTVAEYEERLQEGEHFPPLLVWGEDGAHILLDGWHRCLAMKNIGAIDAECKVYHGTKTEALIAAAISNRNHGLPMKREDKRKAIQMLCESSGGLSSRMIADALGVCNQTVDAVRNELGISPPATRKGKDGKNYPAKMKREPRGSGESKKDDDRTAPPPDPGIGGKSLSPEEISKTENRKGKGVQLANEAIAILQRIPVNDPLRDIGLETVVGWIKENK